MARTESALTGRAVELILAGMSLRHAAKLLGLDKSTLVRACKRRGMVLARGRKKSA